MEFLIENANLTGLTKFLNENYKKKSGGKFSRRDVLGYIERGKLPSYMGDNSIIRDYKPNCSIRLYSIVK
jgi:hypothetical protein